jgi:hypothetical protein
MKGAFRQVGRFYWRRCPNEGVHSDKIEDFIGNRVRMKNAFRYEHSQNEKLARFSNVPAFPVISIVQAHFAFLGADFVLRQLN